MENALFTPWYTFFIFFAFVRVYTFASLAFSSKEYYGHVASADPSETGGGQRGIEALLGRTQLIPVLLIDRYIGH